MGEHDSLLLSKIHLAPQTFAIDTSTHLSPVFALHPHDFLRRGPLYNCNQNVFLDSCRRFCKEKGRERQWGS